MSQNAKLVHTLGRKWEKIISKGFDYHCLKKVQLLSAADGRCKAQFTVAEEHLNPFGSLHGGFTTTIVDTISSFALTTYKSGSESPGDTHVSVDLHMTFLKTAFPGEVVTVNAETIRSGKSLAFLAVEVTKNNGKDVIARGQHTKFITPVKL